MKKGNKEIIIVGDRLLIVPDVGEERSNAGLYLPKWAVEKESIQGGRIVEIGTGTPMANPDDIENEPWKASQDYEEETTTTMQARVGDYAIFLRKTAVDIKYEGDQYLIVPYSAILMLIRENKES